MDKKRRAHSAQARSGAEHQPLQNGRVVQGVVRSSSRRSPAAFPGPRRGPPPVKPTTPRRKSSGALPSMDKESMLIMEANEISQLLHKDYVFSKGQESTGSEEMTTVKVSNQKYGISCLWTIAKLKERLVKMRKLMYAGEAEGAGIGAESVFYDPTDAWEKDSNHENQDPKMLNKTLEEALEAMSKEKNDQSRTITVAPREPPGRGSADGHSSPGIVETSHLPVAEVLSAYEEIGNQTNGDSQRAIGAATRSKSATPHLRLSREPRDRSAPGLTNGGSVELVGENSSTFSRHQDLNNTNRSLTSTTSSELSAESEFIMGSTISESSSMVLPEKYLTERNKEPVNPQFNPKRFADRNTRPLTKPKPQSKKAYTRFSDKAVSTTIEMATSATQTVSQKPTSAPTKMMTLCKGLIKVVSDRTKVNSKNENLVDRIMNSCESIKIGVINILEAFVQAHDSESGAVSYLTGDFGDSEVIRLSSIQLVAALELLVSHTNLWTSSLKEKQLPLIGQLSQSIQANVSELAGELMAFLQGCENDLETLAQDSSSKIIDLLFTLVKNCGELAIATETSTSCLVDPERETLEELISLSSRHDEEVIKVHPGVDLKQSFLGGVDRFLGDTLQASLQSVECCESKIQSLAEECHRHPKSSEADEVLKNVYIVLATSKILVLKTQEVQVDLDDIMKDDRDKGENYFEHYYRRCLTLLTQLNPLVDSLTLVTQASEPLSFGSDIGAMRKVCRCTEMIQRSAAKLLSASESGIISPSSSTFSSEALGGHNGLRHQHFVIDYGILNSSHKSQLTRAGNDVSLATQGLIDMLSRRLPTQDDPGAKSKRMLPATPRGAAVRPITPKSFLPQSTSRPPLLRAKSAHNQNRNRLVRNSWHTFDTYTGSSEV